MPEKKAPAKSSAPKAKATSVKAKSEAAPAKAKAASEKAAAAPVATRGSCTADKCQRPLRAKGYCRKHFMAWRRGSLGAHHHYKICSKEACRKPRQFGGLCAEHAGKGEAAQPATAAAT
jgi:hypothetical protein